MSDTKNHGTVKWFSQEKGYGFIAQDEGDDAFVHESDVHGARQLESGDRVSFDLESPPKGPKAVRVERIEEDEADADENDRRVARFLPLPTDTRELVTTLLRLDTRGETSLHLLAGFDSPHLALNRLVFPFDRGGDDLDPEEKQYKRQQDKYLVYRAFARALNTAMRDGSAAQREASAFGPVPDALRGAHKRQGEYIQALVHQGYRHRATTAQVAWRTVIGLGNATPWETGFTLHRLSGVPYLPTSALKGVARRGAAASGADQTQVNSILGAPGEKAGLQFVPAFPEVDSLIIECDVMTPHHGAYYISDAPEPYRITSRAPNPILFLTVGNGSRFKLHLLSEELPESSMETAGQWLKTGVEMLGIGAKTRVGYGELTVD